jgi:hypothetical protein
VDKPTIQNLLRNNIMLVEFTKSSGEHRIMWATLKEDMLPKMESTAREVEGCKYNDHLVNVYDLEKDAWRSFRLESLKRLSIASHIGDTVGSVQIM